MKNLLLVSGRILFSIPFLVFGIFHLKNASSMAGMVPSFIPGGVFWIYITGLALIAAAFSLYIKKYMKLSMLLVALFLVCMVLLIHLPGLSNPAMQQMAMTGLLKDLGLAGGALTLASIHWNDK